MSVPDDALWVPEQPARWCVRCGGRLSRYNPEETCFGHSAAPAMGDENGRVLCGVCGVRAVSDGNRTCKGCLREARLAGQRRYNVSRGRRKRLPAVTCAAPVAGAEPVPLGPKCAGCGVTVLWQGPGARVCGDCLAMRAEDEAARQRGERVRLRA